MVQDLENAVVKDFFCYLFYAEIAGMVYNDVLGNRADKQAGIFGKGLLPAVYSGNRKTL
jgi:hypothetical protein